MTTPLYFSAKSISMSKRCDRKPQSLLQASRHNLRELQAESGGRKHISMELSYLNKNLHGPGSSEDVVAIAEALKKKYAVPKRKLRKDHVQALEFLISVRSDTDIDKMAYFRASVHWLMEVFGPEMLLSAVVHYDESEPHMHALVLPIMSGQYQGGAPIDRTALPKLNNRFAEDVGKPFGLSFEPKLKLHAAQRDAAFNLAVDHLSEQSDPVISSKVWMVVAEHIKRAPQEFLAALGLKLPDVPRKGMKTAGQIFSGTGKKTSEDRDRRLTHNLSCVGQRNYSNPFLNPGPST